MNKEEFHKMQVELYKSYLENYQKQEDKVGYINSLITVNDRQLGKINKLYPRLEKKLERIKADLKTYSKFERSRYYRLIEELKEEIIRESKNYQQNNKLEESETVNFVGQEILPAKSVNSDKLKKIHELGDKVNEAMELYKAIPNLLDFYFSHSSGIGKPCGIKGINYILNKTEPLLLVHKKLVNKIKGFLLQSDQLAGLVFRNRIMDNFIEGIDQLGFPDREMAIKDEYGNQYELENGSNKTDAKPDLIQEFAKYFSEDADYSQTAIETYLKEWHPRRSFTYFRAKAKKAAIKKCDELEKINNGTLNNWETQCTEFLDSRTEK